MDRRETLERNLGIVLARIRHAEVENGRDEGSVRLIPVSKFHPTEDINILGELGITLVGENREQEARRKAEELAARGSHVEIAMIGQIQSKKANAVARWASEVHSVDSVGLALGLDRAMALALERGDRSSETLRCFVQISADADASRGGVATAELEDVVAAVEAAHHLRLAGVMVVPPLGSTAREIFTAARRTADELGAKLGRKMDLSAGMSGDFEQAIACGSDIVRVGTGVLGHRPLG